MASAISVYTPPSSHRPKVAHDHRLLSLRLLCPEERCCQRALALVGPSSEESETDDQCCGDSPFGPVDAHERLPGYLRDPHVPSFDSRERAHGKRRPRVTESRAGD